MILEINNTLSHNTETMNKKASKPIVECTSELIIPVQNCFVMFRGINDQLSEFLISCMNIKEIYFSCYFLNLMNYLRIRKK
jgi:hypothetical protein